MTKKIKNLISDDNRQMKMHLITCIGVMQQMIIWKNSLLQTHLEVIAWRPRPETEPLGEIPDEPLGHQLAGGHARRVGQAGALAGQLAQLSLVLDQVGGEEARFEAELEADRGLALAFLADLENREEKKWV